MMLSMATPGTYVVRQEAAGLAVWWHIFKTLNTH